MNMPTLLLTILTAATDPQPQSRPAEPAEIGAIHFYNAKTNTLEPLEYRRGVNATRQSGFTNREILEVPGTASPVRFKAGTPLEFIVRAMWSGPANTILPKTSHQSAERIAIVFKDPTNYDLLRLDPNAKTGNRELILTRRGFVNSTGSFGIFVLLKQWTQETFHLRPAETLAPGEYAFKYGLTQEECRELHAFGVDP